MPQRILGIDIGTYSIKIAELVRSFRTFEFVSFYERKIVESEILSRDESVAMALHGLIDDYNLQWDVASCGFPGQYISSRLITFPFGSRKKIEQALEFELETFIPFKLEDIVADYAVLWQTKEASKIMALYAPKKEVGRLLSLLQGAGIEPRNICVEGVELANLVNLGMVPPEGAFALIDIGHEKTTVSIFHGKRLGYVRSVSLAGKAITEAISKELQVPYEEAERIKIEIGQIPSAEGEIIDDLTRNVVKAIKGVADELLLHLRQTMFSYREMEDIPIEGIYLSGGTSRIPGLDSYISDFLKQNVTFLNCMDFHFSKLERAEAHRHVIPQALAIALKEVAGPSIPDVNLRKGDFAFKGDVEQLGGGIKKIVVVLGIIVFLALVHFSFKYYSLKQKVDKIEKDASALVLQALPNTPKRAVSTTTGALSVLKGRRVEIEDRMSKLKATMGFSPFDVLKEISEFMPPRGDIVIDVEDLSITPDRVSLSGRTNSFETVDKVKMALEKSDRFKNVSTGNVRKGTKGEVKFDLSMEIERPEEGARE